MRNSTLLLTILVNLLQILFLWFCFTKEIGLALFEYIIITMCSAIAYNRNKKNIYFFILTSIPCILINNIFNYIGNLIEKLKNFLDSKQQIIK
jgi:hypothetical protein